MPNEFAWFVVMLHLDFIMGFLLARHAKLFSREQYRVIVEASLNHVQLRSMGY